MSDWVKGPDGADQIYEMNGVYYKARPTTDGALDYVVVPAPRGYREDAERRAQEAGAAQREVSSVSES